MTKKFNELREKMTPQARLRSKEIYEMLLEMVEDIEVAGIIDQRKGKKPTP
jgi:hypothetical protein